MNNDTKLFSANNLFNQKEKDQSNSSWAKFRKKFEGEQKSIKIWNEKMEVTKTALGYLKIENKFRLACLKMVEHKFFDNFILFCIVANSATLALFDYSDRDAKRAYNQSLNVLGSIFTVLFTLEAFAKIIAHGFIANKKAYLRDSWNIIDFFVVVTGIFEFLPFDVNLRALRTFRIIRPLKSINAIPSMRHLVTTLIQSLPDFGNVIIFLFFLFIMFSIIGLHQFAGHYTQRCRLTEKPVNKTSWPVAEQYKHRTCSKDNEAGRFTCPKGTFCGTFFDHDMDPKHDGIYSDPSIQFGIISFDNFPKSMLTVFQIITMDNWSMHLYMLMDSSFSIVPAIFLTGIVVFVGFCLMNLILAVIIQSFTAIQNKEMKKELDFGADDPILQEIMHNIDKKKEREKEINKKSEVGIKKQPLSTINKKTKIQDVNDFDQLDQIKEAQMEKSYESSNRALLYKQEKSLNEDLQEEEEGEQEQAEMEEEQEENQESQEGTFTKTTAAPENEEIPMAQLMKMIQKEREGGQSATKMHNRMIELRKKLVQEALGARKKTLEERVLKRSKENQIYKIAYSLCTHNSFAAFVTACIVGNTVVLAMDKYPIASQEVQALEMANQVFTFIFFFEMLLKFSGLGFKAYFQDQFNTFDCTIVVLSIFDFIISLMIENNQNGAFSAMRAFRLLRVFRLAKSWKQFHLLLKTIGSTMKDIANFSVLLFLFMFTYTLLGMEMFGYKAKFSGNEVDSENGEYPDSSFNNFTRGFSSVFIVLANDGWSPIFFDHYRAVGKVQALVYFLSLLIVGQFILLNLFLAILLQNFDDENLKPEEDKKKESAPQVNYEQLNCYGKFKYKLSSLWANLLKRENQQSTLQAKRDQNTRRKSEKSNRMGLRFMNKVTKTSTVIKQDQKIMEGVSLGCLSTESNFRRLCYRVVNTQSFFRFMLFIILISSVQLSLESPLNDPDSQLMTVIFWLDVLSTVIFTVEAVMKIIAFGFVSNGEDSYMQSTWNIFDFILIITTIIGLIGFSINLSGFIGQLFKYIRLVRAFRPIRFISAIKGFKSAVQTLLLALPNILNVTIISALFFLIFGIIGINYFKGQLAHCKYEEFELEVADKWDCLNSGSYWFNPDYNFDNIIESAQTFFHMSTTVGWQVVMYQAISAAGIDKEPVKGRNPVWAYFFICFMIVGSFFILNLFVGIVINTFNREKEVLGKNFLLSGNQKEWLSLQTMLYKFKPKKMLKADKPGLRSFCFELQNHKYFDNFITMCIIGQMILMTVHYAGQSKEEKDVIQGIAYFFYSVFVLEAIIKLIGLGSNYFTDPWNKYDFIIVLGATLGLVLTLIEGFPHAILQLLKTMINTRMFKLVKRSKSLSFMFNTLMATIPALLNVGGLLLIFLYIYAILGVFLFSEVKVQDNAPLTENLNFQTFYLAFLALIRIASGEAWHDLLTSLSKSESQLDFTCISSFSYQDYVDAGERTVSCGHFGSFAYFFTFIILVQLVFLNLFIAIILEGFEDTINSENKLFNQEKANIFIDVWADYDPKGTGMIKIADFPAFMFALPQPMGWDQSFKGDMDKQDDFVADLNMPTYNNFSEFHFMDVMEGVSMHLLLTKNILKKQDEAQNEGQTVDKEAIQAEIKRKFQIEMEHMKNNDENIMALNAMADKNEQREKKAAKLGKDTDISSKHVKAARQIMKFIIIQRRKRAEKQAEKERLEKEQKEEEQRQKQQNKDQIKALQEEKEKLMKQLQQEQVMNKKLTMQASLHQRGPSQLRSSIDSIEKEIEQLLVTSEAKPSAKKVDVKKKRQYLKATDSKTTIGGGRSFDIFASNQRSVTGGNSNRYNNPARCSVDTQHILGEEIKEEEREEDIPPRDYPKNRLKQNHKKTLIKQKKPKQDKAKKMGNREPMIQEEQLPSIGQLEKEVDGLLRD